MAFHPANASSVATLNQEVLEESKAESIFSVTLACTYLLLAMISCFQLGKIIFNRHNLASFHVLFVSLSFLWTTSRAVFFCINVEYTTKSFFAVLWFADDLAITTYALVLVFYIYWIQDEDASSSTPSAETKRVRFCVSVVYGALVLCMFVRTIVMIVWCPSKSCTSPTAGGKDSKFEDWFDTFLTIWYTGLFLVFSLIYVIVQHRRYKQKTKGLVREQLSKHGTHENTMVGGGLMMTFWVIFATHMAYSFVKRMGWWNIEIRVDGRGRKKFGFAKFLQLILWEIVPTSVVLWVFRSIPSTNAAGCTFWSKKQHQYHADYSSDFRTWPRKTRGKRKTHRRGRARSDSELTLSQSQVFYSSNSLVWSSSPLTYSPPMLKNQAAQCLDESPWTSSTNIVQPRKEKRIHAQNLALDSTSPDQLKVPEV